MSLKVGESGKGKPIRLATAFDMSSNTEITFTFIKPDATIVTKTLGAGEITLGTSPVTDDTLGALLANEYADYQIELLFLDLAGTWSVYLTYENTASSPDDVFIGETATFIVTEAGK